MPNLASKTFALAQSGPDLPDRISNKLHTWMDRFSAPCGIKNVKSASELDTCFGLLGLQSEPNFESEGLLSFERTLREKQRQLTTNSPSFGTFHNGAVTFGRVCYAACKALRPTTVVETGVAYGVSSAYILQALSENGQGKLESVDLPPLGRDAAEHVGFLVSSELRSRWKLHRGTVRKLLPGILRELWPIDIFIHDSLHTYAHMKWEFHAALSGLRPGGVLIADDIEGNRAFEEIFEDPRAAAWFAVREHNKQAICGALRVKA